MDQKSEAGDAQHWPALRQAGRGGWGRRRGGRVHEPGGAAAGAALGLKTTTGLSGRAGYGMPHCRLIIAGWPCPWGWPPGLD